MTYGSLFAGVGGFDLGFDKAGMQCRWQVEWDKNCQKLLNERWPEAKHYGDITKVRAGELERVDVVCGGSPCQDLSVAGKRAGMAGGRSGLFHEMARICKRVRPRVIVWENVDGAFSSNEGRDFATVLRAFTGVQVEVPADGWGRAGFIKTPFPAWRWHCAWRLFDAQYFGVPQRRRRVFLVASAGDGSCAEILFEPESLRGDSPPSRSAGSGVARSVTTGSGGGRYDKQPLAVVPEIADCLQERDCKGPDSNTKAGHLLPIMAFDTFNQIAAEVFHNTRANAGNEGIPAIAFNHQAGGSTCPIAPSEERANCLQVGQGQAVAHALTGNGFDASEDGTGRGTPLVHINMRVRRLTPLECERLMGWPDHHTHGFSDSTRYKMCGNGVVAKCSEWIGKRIMQFHREILR